MACRAFQSSSLRIAYVGLPLGALALAQAGHAPQLIGLGHTDAPGARRVRKMLGKRALVLGKPDLEAPAMAALIAQFAPDVLLSWFWPKRIPAAVLAAARLGGYGAHPSLLPRWRGPDPYFWSLLAGDRETGVTLHRLAPEYDTGAVVAQRRLDIAPNENAWVLAKRLDRLSLPLLVHVAQVLARGEALAEIAQDESQATLAPAPDPEQLAVDWEQDALAITRLIRAAAPYPGASADLGDDSVEILEAELFPGRLPKALEPADAVLVGDQLVVQTGAGGLVVKRARLEDGRVLQGPALATLFDDQLSRLA